MCEADAKHWLVELDDLDLERAARDVVVSPLDDDHVVSAVLDHVVDLVQVAAQVFDEHLVAGSLRSVHAGVDQVVACRETDQRKRVRLSKGSARNLTHAQEEENKEERRSNSSARLTLCSAEFQVQ